MEPNDPIYTLVEKIGALEPENSSKIIGYLLLKDFDKGFLMHLAYGPDTLLQSFCFAVKSGLGLTSNRLSVSTPLNPVSRPNDHIDIQPLPQTSSRMLGNRFLECSSRPNPPLSPYSTLNGNPNFNSCSSLLPSSSGVNGTDRSGDEQQLSNYFSFLNDSSLRNKNDVHLHDRSFSANDQHPRLQSDDLGFGGGYRFPQGGLGNEFGPPSGFGTPSDEMDFIRLQKKEMMRMKEAQMATAPLMGDCGSSANDHPRLQSDDLGFRGGYRIPQGGLKAPSEADLIRLQQEQMMRMKEAQMAFMAACGSSANNARLESDDVRFGGGCRFPQGGLANEFGAPSEMDLIRLQQKEMMRIKEAQMTTAPFMSASGSSMSHEKDINLLLQQRDLQGTLFFRFESNCSLSAEAVRNYFSQYGIVKSVSIQYKEERKYGFATFVDAETVRIILGIGKHHFICGSRINVEPYQCKGQFFERKQVPNVTGTDSREITTGADYQFVSKRPRMFSETQEAKRREAEMQLEVERNRLLNLKLLKMENENRIPIESYDHFPPLGNSVTRKKHLQGVDSKDLNKGQEKSLPENLFDSPKNSDETHQDESEKETI